MEGIIFNKYYDRLKRIAESKGGKILSKEYVYAKTKYKFECREGHEFQLTADKVTGRGDWCSYCAGRYGDFQKKYKDFIEKEHNGKMLSDYVNGKTPIKCECNKGHKFYILTSNLLAGKWCGKCKISHGERAVENYLLKNDISFEKEYGFSDLIGRKYPLLFDFAIFKDKSLVCLIEYDGEQHFRPMRHSYNHEKNLKKFKRTQENDKLKNKYCEKNRIPLIRVSCYDVDYRRLKNLQRDMDKVLSEKLSVYLR